MLFFIREDEHSENRNKITSYNEKNITVNIVQDPINQLVLMLQTSYSFKSNALDQQSSTLPRLTYLSQAKLQEPVNTIYNQKFQLKYISKFCNQPFSHLLQKYLQKNEEVRSNKISPREINIVLMASQPLRGSMEKRIDILIVLMDLHLKLSSVGAFVDF